MRRGGVDLYVGQNSRQRGAGFQTGTCPKAVLVFVFFSFQIHRGMIVLTEVKGGIMLPPDSRQQTPLMAVFMWVALVRFSLSALLSLLTGQAVFLTFTVVCSVRIMLCLSPTFIFPEACVFLPFWFGDQNCPFCFQEKKNKKHRLISPEGKMKDGLDSWRRTFRKRGNQWRSQNVPESTGTAKVKGSCRG